MCGAVLKGLVKCLGGQFARTIHRGQHDSRICYFNKMSFRKLDHGSRPPCSVDITSTLAHRSLTNNPHRFLVGGSAWLFFSALSLLWSTESWSSKPDLKLWTLRKQAACGLAGMLCAAKAHGRRQRIEKGRDCKHLVKLGLVFSSIRAGL